jgi:dTDP-4-dehydrorhamnose 3,5-epimerase-like enzyme
MIIAGNTHIDARGTVRFVIDFDMSEVVRMYSIEPLMGIVRAWQGHKIETKWFFVVKGSFLVKTIAMMSHHKEAYFMSATECSVLKIPGGHFNGFEALEAGSILMVFSDCSVVESEKDDWRESLDNFVW